MKNTKKGFTLVELVIVIAVIAILAAVLIPTFGGIIEKANSSNALQKAKNEWTEYLTYYDHEAGKAAEEEMIIVVDKKYTIQVKNGSIVVTSLTKHETEYTPDATEYTQVNEYWEKPTAPALSADDITLWKK